MIFTFHATYKMGQLENVQFHPLGKMVSIGTFLGYHGCYHMNFFLPKKDYLCQGFLPGDEGVNGQCCAQAQYFVLKVFYGCQQNLLHDLDGKNHRHHGELESQ